MAPQMQFARFPGVHSMIDRRIRATLRCTIMCVGGVSALAALAHRPAVWAQAPGSKAGSNDSARAETVLRRTADFYKKANSVAFDLIRSQKFGPDTVEVKWKVAFQRPNRFAIRDQDKMMAFDLVRDGNSMFDSV
jgi:hypothetical protein